MLGWAGVVTTAIVMAALSFDAPRAMAAECAASPAAADLDEFFSGDDSGGLSGADYPHAYALPDGRTLWLFQDAFIGADDELTDDRFAHNAALVQTGSCFELLPPPGGRGTSFLGSWVEAGLEQWIWPLDAEVGADGTLWLFVAEVHNTNATGAAKGAQPVATWRARYELPSLELIDLEPAGDSSSALFGYSIVSDEQWTYLYGHCYRQFVTDDADGFDPACSPHAYLARVPKGRLGRVPEYWSGDGWTSERSARAPVLTAERSMPISVERFGDVYVAVSDENDWFGSDVVIRTSPAPQGPWKEAVRYTPETKCGEQCNNYGAFVLPRLEGGQVVIAHSNNAWDMRSDAFSDASRYRIGVRAVTVPGVAGAPVVQASPLTTPGDAADAQLVEEVVAPSADTAAGGTEAEAPGAADESSRWPDRVPALLQAIGGGLVAIVAGAAAVGFARTLRIANRGRRRRALLRLRVAGAQRAHRPVHRGPRTRSTRPTPADGDRPVDEPSTARQPVGAGSRADSAS